jgi:DnaJ-domain-containing protein 1
MPLKHPCWTRSRVGRNRVHWVAYDDRDGSEGRQILDQGYAASLPEADAAARSSLAALGIYQARRMSTSFRPSATEKPPRPDPPERPRPTRPRAYLYTRRPGDHDETLLAAHLILKKTAKRVYVTRKSCGPDQVGTEDETWSEDEPAIALDRLKLERDGSVYSSGHRLSDFYTSRERAIGDSEHRAASAFQRLGIRPPATLDDIKAAYRRKALEAHPDRGGDPADFQAVEAAYRRLVAEAQGSETKS